MVGAERPRSAALCIGYGGLDLAVEEVLGAELAWCAEFAPDVSRVVAERFPGVPNVGDVTAVDWASMEPVDVLTAGYPCQPFSHAGRRKGTDDPRHLWPHVADAVGVLRPRLVLLENVAGHLFLGFDVVLADLAALGYDTEWSLVRADHVGGCHRRERLFVVATDTQSAERRTAQSATMGAPVRPAAEPGERRRSPADSRRERHGGGQDDRMVGRLGGGAGGAARQQRPRQEPVGRGETPAAHTPGGGRDERPHGGGGGPRGDERVPLHAGGSGSAPADPDGVAGPPPVVSGGRPRSLDGHRAVERAVGLRGVDDVDWGAYEPAVRRHETVLGRCPPPPTTGGYLNPRFVEWMMMLPDGWVTDVLTDRSQALRCLGNGVVPPQAAHALRGLLARHQQTIANP